MSEGFTIEYPNLPEAITTQVNKIAEYLESLDAGFRFIIRETDNSAIIEIEEGNIMPALKGIQELALKDTLTQVDVDNREDRLPTITVTSKYLN
ncbi:MAG: hypothetical protein V4668_00390 [Patescibacteria group bacterium]